MTVADRIAVMREGALEQVGPPAEIYEAPATRYVADFVGDVNLFETRVSAFAAPYVDLTAPEAPGGFRVWDDDPHAPGDTVWLAVRPEKMTLALEAPPPGAPNVLAGEVWDIGYTGDWTTYVVELPGERMLRVAKANAARLVERPVTWEDKVWITFAPDAAMVLTR